MASHMEQLQSDPVYQKLHKEKIKRFDHYSKNQGLNRVVCGNPVQVPIAVHFQDISSPDIGCLTALAQDQIQILNDDIQGLNMDISNWNNNASSSFPGVSNGEACIEFCIANQNHPTGYGLSNGDLAITVNQISGDFSPDWAGYLNIGHYLLLPHVWGFSGGWANDDGVLDTPVSEDPYYGCPSIGVSTCGTTDMHMNYMDYVNDACMYMFTDGQAVRMENYLNSNLGSLTGNASNVCGSGIFPVDLFLIDWKDPDCFGFDDGYILVEAGGGDGNFTYTLNGSQTNTTGDFQNLPAGNYTITVEDGNGTMATPIDIQLIDPNPLDLIIIQTNNVSCYNYNDAIIEVEASGGSGDYTYSINGGTFTASGLFTDLVANVYTIEVLDDNACAFVSNQITIEQPDPFTVDLDSLLAPECGEGNGLIIAEGIGGLSLMGEYTYLLDSLSYDTLMIGGVLVDTIYHDTIAIISTDTLGIFNNLYSGTYTISAIDENGCAALLDSVVLSEDAAIQINIIDSYLNLPCGEDSNGFVGIEGSNTTGPYTYSDDGVNFTSLGLFNNLSSGNYEFYVMDATGCTNTIQIEITAPPILELIIDETNPLLCQGSEDAQLTLIAEGGFGDYSFFQDNLNNPIGNIVSNLGTGIWTFIVQDQNMCTVELDYFITEPNAINISIDELIEVECFGDETGVAQISADGGQGVISFTIGSETNMTGFFTGLTSGTYVVTVTDENDCSSEEVFEIEQSSDLQLSVEIVQEVSCTGDSDGSFSLKGEGGTGNYQYSLDGVNFSSQDFYSGYSAGIYDVFVSDGNDCITISAVEMDDPEPLELTISQLEFLECFGDMNGFIRVDAIGGTGDYTFSNGLSTNTDGLFNNLGGGDYTITVMDENECEASTLFNLNEPEEISWVSLTKENNTCDGKMVGAIYAEASGGTGILNYLLPGVGSSITGDFENLEADVYTIIVRDINGCELSQAIEIENIIDLELTLVEKVDPLCFGSNDGSIQVSVSGGLGGETYTLGSQSNTTGIFTDLSANSYIVTAEDAQGCIASLSVDLEDPNELVLGEIESTDVSCFGLSDGSVILDAAGGTGVISYTVLGETNFIGVFTGLGQGDYTYILEDENGCSNAISSDQFTINQPEEISVNVSLIFPVVCFGDETAKISVAAVGGNNDFVYSIAGFGSSDTGSFEGLGAGSYLITATDGNGCSEQLNYEILQPDPLEAEVTELIDVSCNGESSGAVSFIATGGTPEYTYILDGISSGIPGYINLPASTYTVVISDIIGCSEELQFTISEPDAFTIEAVSTEDNGDQNGSIQITASGGLEPYNIISSGAASFNSDNFANNLSAGFYTIVVEDANQCRQSIEVEVVFNDKLDDAIDGTTLEHVLYPVPSYSELNLSLLSPNEQELYFYILDEVGKLVYERESSAIRGENNYSFNVVDFAPGNYVLGLISDRQKLNFKFQVIR